MPAAGPILTTWLVLVAASLASFGGVMVDRLPRGERVTQGRSRCRVCGRRLDPVDLIPLLGYVIRGGRCAGCRSRIPLAYPLTELGAALLMLALCLKLGALTGGVIGVVLLLAALAAAAVAAAAAGKR